jgi:hypothetical protein
MLWAVYGAIVITLVSLLWTKVLKLRLRNPAYWMLAIAILAAPWIEELWIAYNFDRLCRKDAGVFIYKTVDAEGYYEGTGKVTRLVGRPPFKFIESPDDGGKYRRVEHATEQDKTDALAWYHKTKGKSPGEKDWFTRLVSDRVKVVVEMDTGHAWRVSILDEPTARYQYRELNAHTPVAHEITRFERVVIDAQTGGEVLGRYTNYYRGPYWFFVSLSAPTIPCHETEAGVRKHGTLSLFALTLRPSK